MTVSLKDKKNYSWADGSTDDKELEWTLARPAPVDFIVSTSVLGTFAAGSLALLIVMLVRFKKASGV